MSAQPEPRTRPSLTRYRLLHTLEQSQKEAVASSAMTSTCENFMNAFALMLGASSVQMGLLTGLPQLLGSLMQLVSVWLGAFLRRRGIVLVFALAQTILMFSFAVLAVLRQPGLVDTLIMLFMFYHAASNFIQPQWRAWMGSLVPQKQRGKFFASRTKLTIATSLLTFLLGGVILTLSDHYSVAWIGFLILFVISAIGRAFSCYFLWNMRDPAEDSRSFGTALFLQSLQQLRESMHDPTFRNYTLFVAGMQGTVAISGPFFAVYMLEELHFSYIEYSINLMGSIAMQFVMLPAWGRICDVYGHRLVMLISAAAIPVIPFLWLPSDNYFWLLGAQLFSGIAWSGFNLSIGNYLYDIRPYQTDFATYAAVQSVFIAVLVFIGSVGGGYLASMAPAINAWLPMPLGSALFIVFIVSAVLRGAVLAWFIPRAEEPHIRTRPQLLRIIFRIARYSSVSGVALDWMTVTEKPFDTLDKGKDEENMDKTG